MLKVLEGQKGELTLTMYLHGLHGKTSKAFPNTHKRRPKYVKGKPCFYIRKLTIRRIEQYHSFPN